MDFSTWTADVQLFHLPWRHMKLNNWIPFHQQHEVICQFGEAKLVRLPNGKHDLLGGTDADRAAALEWVSLFAHQIVFTHFRREPASVAGHATADTVSWCAPFGPSLNRC